MNDDPSPRPAPPLADPAAPRARAGSAAGEITLVGLLATLRRGAWLLLAVVAVCLVATVAALKMRAPVYTATMIVAPAERDLGAASRVAQELEQYASLAALAQLPEKLELSSPLERYVELLGSAPVALRLEAEHGLLRRLFPEAWDAERGAWRMPDGLFDRLKQAVRGFFGYPAWTPPDELLLADYLRASIETSRVERSALRQLELQHADGAFAAEVLTLAHAAADDLLRENALARVRAQVARLQAEIGTAGESDRRRALEAMLAEQYQAEALLEADLPFAAEVVRPAAPSSAPTSSGPLVILALAGVAGVILGVFLVFLRDALRAG